MKHNLQEIDILNLEGLAISSGADDEERVLGEFNLHKNGEEERIQRE